MLTSVRAIYEKGDILLLEKPKNINYSKAIVTFINDFDDLETWEAMKLSEASFKEWDNKEDEIYDTL